MPEDVETSLGRFVQLPEVVKYADTTWAFLESPTLPDPCKDPITVIDAEERQILADMDNDVLYYPQRVEDNKVKGKAVPDVLVSTSGVCGKEQSGGCDTPGECCLPDPLQGTAQDFRPFAGTYHNKVDFEEEVLKLGDKQAAIDQFSTGGRTTKSDEEQFRDNTAQARHSVT